MKPRCKYRDPGVPASFLCVLDDGHDGFCEPYVAPTVDEWRALAGRASELVGDALRFRRLAGEWQVDCDAAHDREDQMKAENARLQAELDALRAILESGCDACAHASPKHLVSQEATLAEMRGLLDDDGRDLDAETVARVQAERMAFALPEADVRVKTYQHRPGDNRTEEGVILVHTPTGVYAQCHKHRSRHKNKAAAMEDLKRTEAVRAFCRGEMLRDDLRGLAGKVET